MKTNITKFLPLVLGLFFFTTGHCQVTENLRPNIILILVDDQGYGDLSCQGSPTIYTPNVDKLASEGLRATSFYAAGPVCAPSRRGLLTGRYAARIEADGNEIDRNMLGAEITLGELFKEHGYSTSVIGKWHLGMKEGSHPNDQGFDYFYGTSSSNDHFASEGFQYSYQGFKNATNESFRLPLYEQNDTLEIPAKQELFTQRYTKKALEIIERSEKPFFLYLAYNMPHVPIFASEAFRDKSYAGKFGDVIEEIDWSVGQIMASLEKNNLDENTLIIYTSDNGPWRIYRELGGSAGPFRNGKGTSWEGAFRVPGIFWWPTKIKPSVYQRPISSLDFYHTFTHLLGDSLANDRTYDSKNLLPLLLAEKGKPRNSFAYFSEKGNELWAYREEDYKIHVKTVTAHREPPVKHDPPLLFDLRNDPGEHTDIASEHPELVEKLLKKYNEMKAELNPIN